MPKQSSKKPPRDINQLAKYIVDESTSQDQPQEQPEIDPFETAIEEVERDVDQTENKTEKPLVQRVEEGLKSFRDEDPEAIEKLRESLESIITRFGPKIRDALQSLAPKIEAALQPPTQSRTDAQTYSNIVKLLQSEVEQGSMRIGVYSRSGGNFYFRLEEITHKISDLSKERFDWIVNNEIFNILHYVYWDRRDPYLEEAEKRGESKQEALSKFETTKGLLTPDLEQGILLARSQTAHTLVYVINEIISRNLETGSKTQTVESILLKFIIRDNLLADQYNPWSVSSFECTVADLKTLIGYLQGIVEKLEHKDAKEI